MTTRRAVTETAASVGAELEVSHYGGYTGRGWRVSVYSPSGYVWEANGAHVLVADNEGDGGVAWCWHDTYSRMNCGITRCMTEDCEVCEEVT